MDTDDDGPSRKTKKTKEIGDDEGLKKTFQHKWLEIEPFKGWLAPVPGDKFSAKCTSCGITLKCGKSDLSKHAVTSKHKQSLKAQKATASIQNCFSKKSSKETHEENVKAMEIYLAAFYAQHNIAFSTSDHLVQTIKKGAKDSAIAQDMKLGRFKCSSLVRNVIAKTETEELVQNLKSTLFSIMIDESTDVSNKKKMCILTRYISPNSVTVQTRLLELVEIDSRDTSADALWTAFTKCLEKYGIPVTNILGLACDNAAVTTGCNNSFWTRLKAACPWAILLPCICHSAALITRHACAMLPSFVENLLRSLSTYINGSPKRCAELQDFQELYEEEVNKILKLSGTRWLVMHPCVKRCLDSWDSLYEFFRTVVRECPKDREANLILQDMTNPFTKAYLLFLEYLLNSFNEFNALFQSREILIHKLTDLSVRLLKKFCQNFILPEDLERIDTLNVTHPSSFVPIERLYVGPDCAVYLNTIAVPAGMRGKEKEEKEKELRDMIKTFKIKCLNFYVKTAEEMKARLPTSRLFKEMSFIDSTVLLSAAERVRDGGLPDLSALVSNFQDKLSLNSNALALEWRTIPTEIDGRLREKILSMPIQEAWAEIASMKNLSGQLCFPELTKLAKCVMSLPHSNAEAERVFSVVTDTKNKKRNKLGAENLNAVCVVRSSFASKGITSENFVVTQAHLQKFDASIYQKND